LIYLVDADLTRDGVAFNRARLIAMEVARPIEVAPKNGDCIVLQDASSWELGRWAQQANCWVQLDGTLVRISPTHWTPVSGDVAGATDRERLLFLDAPLPDDQTEQKQKRPLTRLILAFVTAIFCIGGFAFWIGSEDSSSDNSPVNREREFSRERDRASVAIGGLTAAREQKNVAPTEALESNRIANSKQKESKQALDESEARSEMLAPELASARENDVAARNLAAARERETTAEALETNQIADARQMELKQALNESEKTALGLGRGLRSAPETIASAEKPSSAEVTARDAVSPTGPLNQPGEGSNAASENTGSTPPLQSRGNVTTGVQTSSDATPDDESAGASGRLTRANQSRPGRPQPPRAISLAEESKLVARAESLIKQFDFAGARLLLTYAFEKGSTRAAFMMAETYDWQILRSLQAYGVRGDAQRAREFYQLAAAAGIEKARERVEALQSEANFDTRGEDRSR
jgi:hypothetical protein